MSSSTVLHRRSMYHPRRLPKAMVLQRRRKVQPSATPMEKGLWLLERRTEFSMFGHTRFDVAGADCRRSAGGGDVEDFESSIFYIFHKIINISQNICQNMFIFIFPILWDMRSYNSIFLHNSTFIVMHTVKLNFQNGHCRRSAGGGDTDLLVDGTDVTTTCCG